MLKVGLTILRCDHLEGFTESVIELIFCAGCFFLQEIFYLGPTILSPVPYEKLLVSYCKFEGRN